MQANQNEDIQRATAITALAATGVNESNLYLVSELYSLSTQHLLEAMGRLKFNEIAKPIESPFDERSTFILSPLMTDDCSVFLYKPCADDRSYEVTLSSAGTIGVHVSTQELYEAALKYLSHIYGSKPHDEDHECVLWEL